MPDSKHSDALRRRKPIVESKHNILPVESDHADTARYAIELVRMEQALQESERRYCGLVEMSLEAILIHSDDKLAFVSDAASAAPWSLQQPLPKSPSRTLRRSLTTIRSRTPRPPITQATSR
jgi:hypothetical protein